jgi:hypothetical protein
MWATLALALSMNLTPAQPGGVEIKNARFTYGLFGQERPDNKFLPGDVLFLMFDVEGMKLDKDGKVQYTVASELSYKGKPKVRKAPEKLEALLHFGGTRFPSWHRTVLGTDTDPGLYTIKVTVTDRATKKSEILTRSFEVLPKKFGFVRIGLTGLGGDPSPPFGVPGQLLGVNFSLTGFTLNKKTGQPNVKIELRIKDSAGRETLKMPFTGEFKSVVKKFEDLVPFDPIPLPLHQPGRFKIELKAIDVLGKRTVQQELDLTVLDPRGK